MELAIALPLIVLLTSMMVDLWMITKEADVILNATSNAARIAVAQSHSESNTSKSNACGNTTGSNLVLDRAVSFAYQHLKASGIEQGACDISGSPKRFCSGDSYTVSAEFETLCEGGYGMRSVLVSITGNKPPFHFFQLLSVPDAIRLKASSSFVVEADCSTEMVLACP